MIAILFLLTVPHEPVEVATCDVVEVNHYYDGDGRKVFDQAIWYDWDGERHQVRDWRLINNRVPAPACGETLFFDEQRLLRVKAKSTRETWTQYDPELYEQTILPQSERRRFE